MKRVIVILLALSSALRPPSSALAQSDTVYPPRRLFTRNDAVLAGVFTLGTYMIHPLDKSFAKRLQNPRAQEHKLLQRSATFFNTVAVPGAFYIGPGMYIIGRATGEHRAADLGLHGTEAIWVGEVVGVLLKGTFGRARPYLHPEDPNPDDWQLMRGFKPGEGYRSFPSGHSTAAFAAAAAVTAEMSRWSPDTRWVVGTAMYGGAGLVGLSRMYNNRHWASDVIIGAAIGTFAGNKVVRYHHSHPGNKLDEWLVNFTIRGGRVSASVLPVCHADGVKSGIVLLAELSGPVAARIIEIQLEFDPRYAKELPPHVTLTGSSGMGPFPADTPTERLRTVLEPIARDAAPIAVYFQPPMKFMQKDVVVLPLDPNGPIRALHERVKASGIPYERPRFAFTPHCTLSFYPQLTREKLRDLLAIRVEEPVMIDRIAAFKAVTLTRAEKILELPLTGT